MEDGPLAQAGLQPSLTDGGEVLWDARGQSWSTVIRKACWGTESSLSSYLAETKVAACTGCLAAGVSNMLASLSFAKAQL